MSITIGGIRFNVSRDREFGNTGAVVLTWRSNGLLSVRRVWMFTDGVQRPKWALRRELESNGVAFPTEDDR